MITPLIDFVSSIIAPLGAWGVFLGSVLEEVVPPIPSALVQMGAGFILFESVSLSWYQAFRFLLIVVIPATLGVTLGSLFVYWIFYRFGKEAIRKYGRFLGIRWSDIERLERFLARGSHVEVSVPDLKTKESYDMKEVSIDLRYDGLIIFFGRMLPLVPSAAVSAFAGFMRIPLRRYIIASLGGVAIRSTLFGALGWKLGHSYTKYEALFDESERYILIGIVVLWVSVVLYRYIRRRMRQNKSA